MARDKAYRRAEKRIEEARRLGAKELNLYGILLTELPESLEQLTQLQLLDLSQNFLRTLPAWIGKLTQLRSLYLPYNRLAAVPESLSDLTQLQSLNLSYNRLTTLPQSLSSLIQLQSLDISFNQLMTLPEFISAFTQLKELNIAYNSLKTLPDWIGGLNQLQVLESSMNGLTALPQKLGQLTQMRELNLFKNQLSDLPPSLAKLEHLLFLSLDDNPLNPELAVAYKQGIEAVNIYLRAKAASQIFLDEAKLILIGEGAVGKTCLMDALLDDPWQEHDTTHGIKIKQVKITDPDSGKEITLNGWDFGGQPVYRPTHQLFFSAPAVYLVVWKPREGPQQGFVKEWIQLVKRREPTAKILVVATHGGSQQRHADIDRQELWELFSRDTVLDFFHVESKPDPNANGERLGIEELKRTIAHVASTLPEVGRSVPKRWQEVREALAQNPVAYLPLERVLKLCRLHQMDDNEARLFVTIEHRLGHLIHYQHDPALRDIVVLKPDWLATAISFVLDDGATRNAHGLVRFSRLSRLWDDPARAAEMRYSADLHPIFLRLMERFDLSYRVADPSSKGDSDPQSLIAQLVPDIRPANLEKAWSSTPPQAAGDTQQTQICRIVDAQNGQSASAEGLFYQLIVRLHKYSLGRVNYNDSVHWRRGLVLDDYYNGRALLEYVGNDVRITVRAPYPERFLAMLTSEVKYLVESFWEGLRCDVMVPCIKPCGRNAPGTGLFEVEKLIDSKRKSRHEFPCPVCTEWQNIDSLLRNAPAAARPISLGELQIEFASIKDKLDEVNVNTRRILSQVDKSYTDLLQVLTDEAKEGPRLFSLFPLDHSNFNPKNWIREKFRLVLWCEHSRLPLPALNNGDMNKGVYDLELDREWFKKAAPYLKFLSGTLSMVLPVASSAIQWKMDDAPYKLIEEQLNFGKSVIEAVISETVTIGEFMGAADSTNLEHGIALRAENATLRELHALLKAKDPGFGGLVRVLNKRNEFLWVHEKFAGEY